MLTSFPRLSVFAALVFAGFTCTASAQTYELHRAVPDLVVTGSAPAGPPAAPAAQGALALSTSLLNFGEVATHTTSTRQVQVGNTGDAQLTLTALPAVMGASAFTAGLTSCPVGALAPGDSCLVEVSFSPTEVGPVTGGLSVSTTLPGSPDLVNLTGVAYNPLSLEAATLPTARKGQAYSVSFASKLRASNESYTPSTGVTWQQTGSLPTGISFLDGVLSGTPTALTEGMSFEVLATYKGNEGRQTYTIKVRDVVMDVIQIAAGPANTCAVTVEGAAKCWGYNGYLQASLNSMTSGVAQVTLGDYHACALTTAGGVKCVGYNGQGQLGDGTKTNRSTPVDVVGLSTGVAQVTVGGSHTCARLMTGSVKCWGANTGAGTAIASATPVDVVGLSSGVAQVEAGLTHVCALTTAGAVQCWGSGSEGQLGNGTTGAANSPVALPGLSSGVSRIATGAGARSTCAVLVSGSAKCWGSNPYGGLGDGTKVSRSSPVDVVGLSNVASIAVALEHTCAVTTSGGAKCWGRNANGRLGNGVATAQELVPVDVTGFTSGVAGITAGGSHSCLVATNNAAKCWGYNNDRQLGDGTTTQRYAPVSVLP